MCTTENGLTTKRGLSGDPNQSMREFREWLDSLDSDSIQEIDIRPEKPLLNALVSSGDVLPANYCERLGIPEGSSYRQAVQHLRSLDAERRGDVVKPYRVTLLTSLQVEIDVDGISKDDAEAKAWEWWPNDREDYRQVGCYTLDDDDLWDDSEMYWKLVDREIEETVSIQELVATDADEPEA